jgi:hypothetical protein
MRFSGFGQIFTYDFTEEVSQNEAEVGLKMGVK